MVGVWWGCGGGVVGVWTGSGSASNQAQRQKGCVRGGEGVWWWWCGGLGRGEGVGGGGVGRKWGGGGQGRNRLLIRPRKQIWDANWGR